MGWGGRISHVSRPIDSARPVIPMEWVFGVMLNWFEFGTCPGSVGEIGQSVKFETKITEGGRF